jgi:sec-independent protein translocase protein TatA
MFTLAALGTTEWLIIGLVVFLLFGARKMPALARSLGSSVVEFRRGLRGPEQSSSGTDRIAASERRPEG